MKYLLYFTLLFSNAVLYAGSYWQQEVNYKIRVTLDDVKHELLGDEDLTYTNHSPDDLSFIYFNLWANAFSNKNSAFGKQKLRTFNKKFYFAPKKDMGGYIDISFETNGQLLTISYLDKAHEMAKVSLPRVLKQGESIHIKIHYRLKIPYTFSRLGHVKQSYQMSQWYPKPAVYDTLGWHPMPYLDLGEFYSEFGHFDVEITLPSNYVVGATGTLKTEREKAFVDQKISETKTFLAQLASDSTKHSKKDAIPPSNLEMKTLKYVADAVHDFAWFADKRFLIVREEARLPSGKVVPTFGYFLPHAAGLWSHSAEYVKDAIEFFSEKIGEYPWPHASAVLGPLSAGGGMEYPMITIIAPTTSAKNLDLVINHEVGHNWYYGILASNERDHAWMDEGMNSYMDARYALKKYGNSDMEILPSFVTKSTDLPPNYLMMLAKVSTHTDQPGDLPSDDYLMTNYQFNAYTNPQMYFSYLEKYVGTEKMDRAVQHYFDHWKFRHPYPKDVQQAYEASLGKNLDWLFEGLLGHGTAPDKPKHMDYALVKWVDKSSNTVRVKNKGVISAPVLLQGIHSGKVVKEKWFEGFEGKRDLSLGAGNYEQIAIDYEHITPDANPENQCIRKKGWAKYKPIKISPIGIGINHSRQLNSYIIPTVGFNAHDGFMAGVLYHNITLPARAFQYYLLPMYGFRSKKLAGMADFKYNYYPAGTALRRIQIGVFGRKFTQTSKGSKNNVDHPTGKISPYVRLRFKQPMKSLTLHDLSIGADFYLPNDITYTDEEGKVIPNKRKERFRISYHMSNNHPVFPKQLQLNLYRAQYSDDSETGLSALFHGKWYYTAKKNMEYRLFQGVFLQKKNAGIKGQYYLSYVNEADNAFLDDYYLGRNPWSKFYSHQIQIAEGGFKEPILIGATRSLTALNLESDIPKVPLIGVFVDQALAINADASAPKYFMSAGLSLRAQQIIGIYFPLYRYGLKDAYRTQRPDSDNWWRSISFQVKLKWNLNDLAFDQLYFF